MWSYSFFFALTSLFLLQTNSHVTRLDKTKYLRSTSPGVKVIQDDIRKPLTDKSSYRLIELANKLQVVLVSNPDAQSSIASMSVGVGHFLDPENAPGLAHFCEHLLFMGTKKYPGENDYSEFLASHSGYSNAYTSTEETVYYFDVLPDYFEGALDRFAQFFIAPLFSKSAVNREAHAVDLEHKKNLRSDAWRVYQLEKSLSNPKSPYSKFGTGNYQTLIENTRKKGIDVLQLLLDYHSKYYSANLMKLVVMSKESLDSLQNLVVKYFSDVPNKDVQRPVFTEKPFTSSQFQTTVFYQTLSGESTLELMFPVESQTPLYKTRPFDYLIYLLEHQASGSIYQELLKNGWGTSISCGIEYIVSGVDAFRISIELTEAGYENYQDVVFLVFQYLSMLRVEGPKSWIGNELILINNATFSFFEGSSETGFVTRLASVLQYPYIKPEDLIISDYTTSYSEEDILSLLDLLQGDRFILSISSATRAEGWDSTEPIYGTLYQLVPFTDAFKKKLVFPVLNPSLGLPLKNKFIPQKFYLNEVENIEKTRPLLVFNNSLFSFWHRKDVWYNSPRSYISFIFKSPLYHGTPRHSAQVFIFTDMLVKALSDSLYYAKIAGYTTKFVSTYSGFEFTIYGYTGKLIDLLDIILKTIFEFTPTLPSFTDSQQTLLKRYVALTYRQPSRMLLPILNSLYSPFSWLASDIYPAIQSLQYADFRLFQPIMFARFHLEGLAVGVISNRTSNYIIFLLSNKRPALVPMRERLLRTYILQDGGNYIYEQDVPNPLELNSAVLYSIQIPGSNDPRMVALLELLYRVSKEPAFNQLRTKEQLAYYVRTSIGSFSYYLDYRIAIQSIRHPFYLEQRITAFLYKLAAIIDTLSEEKFQTYVQATVFSRTLQTQSIFDEASVFWSHIKSGFYDFESSKPIVEALQQLKKHDLQEFFYKYIYPGSRDRRKLSVHLKSRMLDEVSPRDLSSEKLYLFFKCHGLEISLNDIIGLIESSPKFKDFQKALISFLQKKYPTKSNISSLVLEALAFLKKQYSELRSRARQRYRAVHFSNVILFKKSLKLSPVPFPKLPLSQYNTL